jgi:hypothetical protein
MEICKNFSVKNTTTTNAITWDEISSHCRSATWRNLWTECVSDSSRYQEKTFVKYYEGKNVM